MKFPEKFELKILSRDWVLKHWGPPPQPSKEMLIEELVYKLSLLVSPDFNITKGKREWAASFMAATAGYTLYVIKENFNIADPVARRAIAHELVHILQYHYFRPHYPTTLDKKMAIQALIEGDADLVADIYCNLTGMPPRPKPSIPINNPYIALQSFPYIYGECFVSYLYDRGGWKLVNQAYKIPPISTEQVIHPEKYLKREQPVNTTLITNETGKPLYINVMGEYYVLLILITKIGMSEALRASEGWGGDLLELFYVDEAKEWRLYWNITWDTVKDAQEFYDAFNKALRNIGAVKIMNGSNRVMYKVWSYIIEVFINNRNVLIKSVKEIK